ncbi:transcriptional activator [Yamadazyma tenuis]|uniref:PH domain-containing protein n=1 Tax=Candida tenuis (strain ATCC 10573 / BCRC 21748 / CBS 615 / JCM 9827 / NBRC 10315 / NRRL Y-1498 / VKM Y-70) TaxID=590646 RepID=G3AWK5_CANTC|nr:uncharacterized protein CANTEDRAFT_132816 [Yamadazyma tenuis ATCC 10573]EGV66560.1 hypothetical protein CANTEDRAFT_132816 [Yamadazyma tenuis ATCC 10573]WEJ95318.1 transcriptional activator [Yamadazyma tenuis]
MTFVKEDILPSTNPLSPFYNNLPSQSSRPIDELVTYFKNYKTLIKNLLHYFKEIALVKEFESNLNHQLLSSYSSYSTKSSTQSPPSSNATTPAELSKRPNLFKTKSNSNYNFLKSGGNGSGNLVNTINHAIMSHHQTLYSLNLKHYKELSSKLIPKSESLLRNLSVKIKEIKSSLKNDSFVNDSILREISKTGALLKAYTSSVEAYNTSNILLDNDDEDDEDGLGDPLGTTVKHEDPFLLKLRLNYQLKNQLIKENYLFAAFVNLQNISKDLLTYVLKDLTQILDKFEKMNTGKTLDFNINLNSNQEWESFIMGNPSFLNVHGPSTLNPKREIRHFKNIVTPYANSVHNKCIRFGIIYKKSKLLKNYNRYYYLLTCNFLHEFRIETNGSQGPLQGGAVTSDKSKTKLAGFISHNDIPSKSFNLNNYKIVVKNEKSFKFNLVKLSSGKQSSFKCNNATDFTNWVTDLTDLLQFEADNISRFEFVQRKLATRTEMKVANLSPSSSAISTPSGTNISKPLHANANANANSTLNLPNISNMSINDSASQPSLQGVFTPQIRTPSSSGSDRNPFDTSFTNFGNATSPHSNSNSNPTSPGLSTTQHEDYLRLQQEHLKQQQMLIDLKLREAEKIRRAESPKPSSDDQSSNPHIQIHHSPGASQGLTHGHSNSVDSLSSTNLLSNLDLSFKGVASHSSIHSLGNNLIPRTGSNTSIVSMESVKSANPSKINAFLQQNENLVPKFFVTDETDKE